jgi:hypothetical protein
MAALRHAWHSVLMPVYHDNPACTEGNNIEEWNVRPGRGGRRRCHRCADLDPPLLRLMRRGRLSAA